MPLRAAPGEKLGAAACAAETKNAQPVLQMSVTRPAGRLPARQRTGPAQASQPGPWQHREALRATLRLIPLLLGGQTETG
jgi:hypothetical protein